MKKRMLYCIFVLCFSFFFLPKITFAAEITASGTKGDNITWTLYDDGKLVISGTGNLGSYTSIDPGPWCDYIEEIRSVVIEEGITGTARHAFRECENIVEISLPESLTSIAPSTFSWCDSIDTLIIPKNVREVGSSAFAHCLGMESIYFMGPAPEMGSYAFDGMNISIYYPREEESWNSNIQGKEYGANTNWVAYDRLGDEFLVDSGKCGPDVAWTLTNIGQLTISGNGPMKEYDEKDELPWYEYSKQINQILIKEGVTTISPMAFYGMDLLESVSIPRGLTHLGDYAFKNCKNLYHVWLPSTLKRIGESAFYGCQSMWSINIPEGIYTIWEYTFKNCTALKSIAFPKTLIKIDEGAFENCIRLYNLYFPEDLDIIGCWSFKGCTGLEYIRMKGTDVTEVREGAFKNCTALEDIQLPDNIEVLGDSCFYGIAATSFTVPATVTDIEPWCFARAYSLKEMTFEGDAPTIGEGVFNKIELTAYYPILNDTWTEDVMKGYGGTVTWVVQ